jgi:hypothetical protein
MTTEAWVDPAATPSGVGLDERDLLPTALRDPQRATAWDALRLSLLLFQARRAGLLGRLADRLGAVPGAVWPAALLEHFEAARRVSRAQQAEIRREAAYLVSALEGVQAPIVLLKGAAYVMAGLPAATGRVFGDIDLMVPRRALDEVEARLVVAGWRSTNDSAYDQRYYRQWMHELPPMEHQQRGTALDVHHAIVPLTARLKPDASSMFERAQPLPGLPGLFVLAPDDLVLHSITHLFMNDDTGFALRDLSDLDLLLRHFAATETAFWPRLVERAKAQGLGRPLYHATHLAAGLLGTPVAPDSLRALERFAPPGPRRALMNAMWSRVVRSPHPSTARPGAGAALALLYLRGHWLRMPLPMLARHLLTKAARRMVAADEAGERTVG